jgi:hypothetical protein
MRRIEQDCAAIYGRRPIQALFRHLLQSSTDVYTTFSNECENVSIFQSLALYRSPHQVCQHAIRNDQATSSFDEAHHLASLLHLANSPTISTIIRGEYQQNTLMMLLTIVVAKHLSEDFSLENFAIPTTTYIIQA